VNGAFRRVNFKRRWQWPEINIQPPAGNSSKTRNFLSVEPLQDQEAGVGLIEVISSILAIESSLLFIASIRLGLDWRLVLGEIKFFLNLGLAFDRTVIPFLLLKGCAHFGLQFSRALARSPQPKTRFITFSMLPKLISGNLCKNPELVSGLGFRYTTLVVCSWKIRLV
jgi:hypothetical protein